MERDQKVLDMIELLNVAKVSQIYRMFYKGLNQGETICRRRMKKLYDDKLIKRERNHLNTEYVYYMNKNNQFNHSLILTEFYVRLHELADIDKFEVEQPYGNIRPDGMCICGYRGFTHYFFIEVHISNNKFNQDKYISYYGSREWKQYFDVFPKIIIISDKKVEIKPTNLKFIQIQQSCEDIINIFRG
jgi:DNA-binding Lrp family transcriptional regulator